ncbi:pentapeptide repeat-containing protein [Microcoleus sp. MOSTC5]
MANRIVEFLKTDIKELCSADAAEAIGEAGKTAAEVAKMFKEQGLDNNSNLLLEVLNSPLAQVVGTGLPLVGIAAKLLALFIEKTQQQPTLAECIFFVSQEAYLESFKDFIGQDASLLNHIGQTPVSDKVKQLLKKLAELQFSDKAAKETVICFRDSILAKEFNLVLSERLQQAGLNADEAQILTKRVAANTHHYLIQAWAVSGDAMKHLGQPSISEWREEQEKYQSIDKYLKDQIRSLPEKRVFEEIFFFKDIYVPLKAKPIDKNGEVNKRTTAFDLETWAKQLLEDESKQNRVMFVEAGPGRGKSVFCRMFTDWVRQNLHPIWTPVLIRLREIPTLQKSFRETLKEAVNTRFASDDGWLTDRNTRYLFFLDGFDELVMEGRSSGGLEKFLKQVGQFQQDCDQNSEMGHRVLITGRTLALQGIERQMPDNLERVEIQVMDDGLQQQWLSKWEALFGAEETSAFQQFLQHQSCPENVKSELSREPLLLYLLAAMHRNNRLKVEAFQGTNSIQAKILIYNEAVNWVLTEQRSKSLNLHLTGLDTENLRRILTEAGLCVVQSGGERAPVAMIAERLKEDESVKEFLEEAQKRIDDPLTNALAAFYLQQGSKEGSVEFVHKSFGEFLCAERLKESLQEWTEPGNKRIKFNTQDPQMDWEIYDLLGYGPLTEEIVEYLMGLLTTRAVAGEENQFRPVELFQRLENFYLGWCKGEFIDEPPENLPQKKMRLLRDQLKPQKLGQRQIDVYAGLNVMILLLELHRYGQETPEFKDKMVFYPCGKPNAEGKLDDASRLLRLIGYSCCVGYFGFLDTVGRFLSGAYLSRADLRAADLSDAELSDADLSRANLSRANLSHANLSGANLSHADLRRASLSDADLSDADLSGANLSSASLSDADLSDADLSGANLSSANLRSANLWGANLSSANLRSANLSGADLSDANLSDADLWDANLSGANLSGANLSGANLSDRTIGDIKWDEDTNWENVRGLDTAVFVPEALRRQLGMQ